MSSLNDSTNGDGDLRMEQEDTAVENVPTPWLQ